MRCAMCQRPLRRAAVTLMHMALGPKCAERAGFIARRAPGAKLFSPLVVARDKHTQDMFEGQAA